MQSPNCVFTSLTPSTASNKKEPEGQPVGYFIMQLRELAAGLSWKLQVQPAKGGSLGMSGVSKAGS